MIPRSTKATAYAASIWTIVDQTIELDDAILDEIDKNGIVLLSLNLRRDAIPFPSGSETALQTEGESLERNILAGFLDLLSEPLLVFHSQLFGRHQAEHHHTVFRNKAEWFEGP
ncbi:MAG: hypothetical protein IRY86_05505 [Thermorudis peleae]|nr:hypothetical protein [Thermorudis peleae]